MVLSLLSWRNPFAHWRIKLTFCLRYGKIRDRQQNIADIVYLLGGLGHAAFSGLRVDFADFPGLYRREGLAPGFGNIIPSSGGLYLIGFAFITK
jgi:hypothetical protein